MSNLLLITSVRKNARWRMSDANLRQIFQRHLPEFHWQSVETWSTGRGVPDLNYCTRGVEGWVECKRTLAWAVNMAPEQVGWIERRVRNGGRVYIAVRRITTAGPRRGVAVDELYLIPGGLVRAIDLRTVLAQRWSGGPARWDWSAISLRLLA